MQNDPKVVGLELLEKIAKPLIFKDDTAGLGMGQPTPVNGYDVTILIDLPLKISYNIFDISSK